MKKSIFFSLLAICLLTLCSSCTQNGGHIGKLFGRWHLERIEADGVVLPESQGGIFLAFQGKVMELLLVKEEHESQEVFASFREEDNTIFLDFCQKNMLPYPQTGLLKESELQILRLTGKELVCVLHPEPETDPEASLTYYLRKW